MDMHAPLRMWIITADIEVDLRRTRLRRLLELDDAADFGIAPDNGDCGKSSTSVR